MELQRTANAGVLLKMDGVSILLDGLADRVEGYLPTPVAMAEKLLVNPPDALVYTHNHPDHCSDALLLPYRKQNLRPIYGPESLYLGAVQVGDIKITPVKTRHIGRVEPGLCHVSYVIEGSKCVWFTGDAAPLQWRDLNGLPRPDVLIAPYAYAKTISSWDLSCSLTDHIILVHLPNRGEDPYQLWNSVESNAICAGKIKLFIPEVGETLLINP